MDKVIRALCDHKGEDAIKFEFLDKKVTIATVCPNCNSIKVLDPERNHSPKMLQDALDGKIYCKIMRFDFEQFSWVLI